MAFWNSKKKSPEGFKTLSEKDIQGKLYGHLRHGTGGIQADLPPFHKQQGSLPPSAHKPPQVMPKEPAAAAPASTATLSPLKPSLSTSTASDLFKSAAPAPQSSSQQTGAAASSKHEFREGAKYTPLPTKPGSTAGASSAASYKPARPSDVKTSQKKEIAVFEILKQGARQLGVLLIFSLTAVLSFFAALDFRKPVIRRLGITLAAAAALFLIFFGIHHLNLNREQAMKDAPKRKRAVSVQKPQTAQVPPEAESILSAPDSVEPLPAAAAKKVSAKKKKTPGKSAELVSAPAQAASGESGDLSPVQKPYVIQVATFAAREDAQKLTDRFKEQGMEAFLKPFTRAGGRNYYCVFVGRFKSREEAEAGLLEFKKQKISQPFQDAFVRNF